MKRIKKAGDSHTEKQAPPYEVFAQVYDQTMQDVPYLHWAGYIFRILDSYGLHQESSIAEFGCGTGVILQKLKNYYHNMLGMDLSFEMLTKAAAKGSGFYVQGDLVSLPIQSGSLEAALCLHDSLNYLETHERLEAHFQEAARVLQPGGIYIFDFSTEYNAVVRYHNKTFTEWHNDYKMVWSNCYDFQEKVITSKIVFYDLSRQGKWKKLLARFGVTRDPCFVEIHRQKIFSHESILKTLRQNGFSLVEIVPDYDEEIHPDKAHLLVYVARKDQPVFE